MPHDEQVYRLGTDTPVEDIAPADRRPGESHYNSLYHAAEDIREKLHADLPDVKSLPKHYQEFFESLNGVEPFEKMNLVHQFAQGSFTYEDPDTQNEKLSSFSDVLQNKCRGDCDDYMSYKQGLLKYAGFKHGDIGLVSADVEYRTAKEADSSSGGHATVTLDLEGKRYLMDMNLNAPVEMNGASARGVMEMEDGRHLDVNVKIAEPYIIGPAAKGSEIHIYPGDGVGLTPDEKPDAKSDGKPDAKPDMPKDEQPAVKPADPPVPERAPAGPGM